MLAAASRPSLVDRVAALRECRCSVRRGGGPTAGTNGNIVTFALPGGYRVTSTGMKVLKHDGSQHHGIGILPTIPVSRTRAGVAGGRDELLDRAVQAVR